MNASVRKLKHFIDESDAEILVEKGYDLPRKIKAVTDAELRKYGGLTQARVNEIRKRLPRSR